MNFPQRFIAFTAIVFSIVLFLLCGHSRAAPAVRFKKCTSDYECNPGEFCRQNSGASYCDLCLDCNRYDREPSRRCARLRTDCGPCQPGFGEFGPYCSRLAKEIVTGYIMDQTFKHEGAKLDQPEGFSRWLVVSGVSAVVVIVMAVGVVVSGEQWVGGVEELDENNDNEDELNENSMDLEPFAGNNNDNNENQQENWHAMDHNYDHHLNPDGNNEQQVHEDNNNQHQVNGDNNNGHQVNEDNNNGHLIDIVDVPAANALPDVWQDPEDPGIFFNFHPQEAGFHGPPHPNVPEDNVADANGYEDDQYVPNNDHNCFDLQQQGLQILDGDLVQNFYDGMDNYPMCG